MGLNRLQNIFAPSATILLILFVAVGLVDYNREWKKYQREYNQLWPIDKEGNPAREGRNNLLSRLGGELNLEIRQVVLKDLGGRIDRCTTCHLGVENPKMVNASQPYRTHPGTHLRNHPLEKFGCTVCHLGQGQATTYRAASHQEVAFWEETMLPTKYLQAACGKCHLPIETPEAPELALGKRLFDTKGCHNCHKIGTRGRSVGPELTKVGQPGHRTPEWLYEHFKDPAAVSPGSKMPKYGFTDRQARALTVYMLSLVDEKMGVYYLSKKIIPEISVGKALFEEKGCLACHRLYGRGGTIGPDLTYATERRRSKWLFAHFKDPQVITPGSVMPKFGFSDEEAAALTKFITQISARELEGADALQGRKIFDENGCLRCHKLKGRGGNIGPDLTFVASRRDIKWIMDHFRDPQDVSPGTEMPQFNFSKDEIKSLTAFLLSLTTQEVVGYLRLPGEESETVKAGRQIFEDECMECHQVAGEGGDEASDLTNIASYRSVEWMKRWIKDPEGVNPDTEMPELGLSDEDIEAVVKYLSIQK